MSTQRGGRTNVFGAFGASGGGGGSGAARAHPDNGKKKKKKRRKRKKKDAGAGAAGSNSRGSGIHNDPRVRELLTAGYSIDEITSCMDDMFAKNIPFDTAAAVQNQLELRRQKASAPSNSSSSSELKATPAFKAEEPDHSGSDAKSLSASAPQDTSASDEAGVQTSAQSGEGGEANLDLLRTRLEEATKVPEMVVVLPALTQWCRGNGEDIGILFDSLAMQQLLGNYTRAIFNIKTDADREQHHALMSMLLSTIFDSSDLATELSSSLMTFATHLDSMQVSNAESSSIASAMTALLTSKLKEIYVALTREEDVPARLRQLDTDLSANAQRISQNEGSAEGTNLGSLFKLRDLQNEKTSILTKRGTIVIDLANGKRPNTGAGGDGFVSKHEALIVAASDGGHKSDEALLAALGFDAAKVQAAGQAQASAHLVKEQLSQIDMGHQQELQPVTDALAEAATETAALEKRAAELAAELAEVNTQLQAVQVRSSDLAERKRELMEQHGVRMSKLNEEHAGLVTHLQRAEGHRVIVQHFKSLKDTLKTHTRRLKASARSGASAQQRQAQLQYLKQLSSQDSRDQALSSALASAVDYAGTERKCLTVLRGRIQSCLETIEKIDRESAVFAQLHLEKVEEQMQRSRAEQLANMQLDTTVMQTLTQQANEVFEALLALVERSGPIIDRTVFDLCNRAKSCFISLECVEAVEGWDIIYAGPAEAESSGSKSEAFNSQKAQKLGLSALLPRNFSDQPAEAGGKTALRDASQAGIKSRNGQIVDGAAQGVGESSSHKAPAKQQQLQRRPRPAPTQPKQSKPTWGGWTTPAGSNGDNGAAKSLLQIQAEEEEKLRAANDGAGAGGAPMLRRQFT